MKTVNHYFWVLLLILFTTACGNTPATPDKTATKFTTALFHGKSEEVYALLYIVEVKPQGSPEKGVKSKVDVLVQESKKTAEKKGGLKQVITAPPHYNKDKTKATVAVTAKFNNGEESKQTIDLIEHNKKWLIFLK